MTIHTWLYDLPRLGPYLRKRHYRRIFDLRPGEVAIDLGANVGKITQRMAKPGVEVFAFEPDPEAFKKLREKFLGHEHIHCIEKAVSDHAGRERIYFHTEYDSDPAKWSVATSLFAEKGNVDKDHSIEVEVVDIVEFVKRITKPIGLMKIDIEGEEVKVLNKLISTGLSAKIRQIVVETHERLPFLKKSTSDLKKQSLHRESKISI